MAAAAAVVVVVVVVGLIAVQPVPAQPETITIRSIHYRVTRTDALTATRRPLHPQALAIRRV